MDRRSRRPGRCRSAALLAAAVLVAVACGDDDVPPPDLASPSAACTRAFAEAEAAGERPAPERPRSPDLDALQATLDACESPDAWLTAVRAHPGALPLELDRETALDQLCTGHRDTAVCGDWAGTVDGPAG